MWAPAILHKNKAYFCAFCLLYLSRNNAIMYLQGKERKVMSMKMFLLGMLTMYLGTTIITTIASIWIDTDDFLEIVFFFPLAIIAKIIKPIKNFVEFPKVCIFLLLKGVNPWNFTYSQVIEMSEENQQKFIKAHPKKYQKKVEKILDDLKK